MNDEKVKNLIKQLLIEFGEDPNREGLIKTPERVMKAYKFLLQGYSKKMDTIINQAIFQSEVNNMIIIKNIEIYSLCEHHMLPFFGKCHIGYIPTKKILGISKLCRIAEIYARRLQVQERLTSQIAKEIFESINAHGVGVVMECQHLCMMMRGVEKQNSIMITSSVLGSFHDDTPTRIEFMNLVKQ